MVLAGGASSRMGAPKALATIGGVAMARLVADALVGAGADPVVVQGGPDTTGVVLGLEVVADDLPGAGPLAALASATGWAAGIGAELVVVAACDQPDLTAATVTTLVDALAGGDGDPVVSGAVPRSDDGRRHPFPSVWRTAVAPALRSLVADGARRADAALTLAVVEVVVAQRELVDIDTPEALAGRQDPGPYEHGGTGP